MNSKELLKDIVERENLLRQLDKSNPLYPIMENELYAVRERYELILMSEKSEDRRYHEKVDK